MNGEKRQSDGHRCHECCTAFLDRQHENGEDEHEGEDHLQKEPLKCGSASTKGILCLHCPWQQCRDHTGSSNGTEDLHRDDTDKTDPVEGSR